MSTETRLQRGRAPSGGTSKNMLDSPRPLAYNVNIRDIIASAVCPFGTVKCFHTSRPGAIRAASMLLVLGISALQAKREWPKQTAALSILIPSASPPFRGVAKPPDATMSSLILAQPAYYVNKKPRGARPQGFFSYCHSLEAEPLSLRWRRST